MQSKNRPPEEQIVTSSPDLQIVDLTDSDRFLILACDGIWDILTNDEAVSFVAQRLDKGTDPHKICEEMCDHCLASNTEGIGKGCDNMSAMVVVFRWGQRA
jgi:serine/threonine protein phosphatase PrpC